jgi:hypothetical protein
MKSIDKEGKAGGMSNPAAYTLGSAGFARFLSSAAAIAKR